MQLRYGDCVWCETRSSEAGDFPDRMSPFREHALYQRLLLDGKVEELDRRGVLDAENVLWRTGAVVGDLPKPDLLHCIQLGILSHLLDWVVNFLQESQRLELFDQLWVSIPPYQDMLCPKKSFQEVSSWQGKEIKTMSRFMLACFAASLDNPPNNETRESFDEAILCVRAALKFYMYARYPSHTETTLGYMSDSLRCFHDHKKVFSRYRADKKVRAAARTRETDMIAEREEELREPGLSATQKRNITTRWGSRIDSAKTAILEDGGQFNFPKMHAMRHFVPQIKRFGSLLGFDSSIAEVSHKVLIKHGYNASNRSVGYTEQISNYNAQSEQMATRHRNVNWARQKSKYENRHANKTLPPKPTSTLTSRQYVKGRGKIKNFRDLLTKVSLPQTHTGLYDLTHVFVDQQGFDLTRDELLAAPAALYHSLHVSVEDWQKYEWKTHNIRATNDREWMLSGRPRHDWVWVRQKVRRQPLASHRLPFKALRGRLPAQVCFFFSLSIANQGKPREVVRLALARITEPLNGGTAENAPAMPRVATPAALAKRYAVIHAGSIEGAAHLVPLLPDEEKNKRWIVNTHIDLETWNNVYEFVGES
jgi:hypothetical protein